MTTFEMKSKFLNTKIRDRYKFSKRHWYQLGIGLLIVAIGVLMILWPVKSSRIIFSFLGVFFIATGVQVSLWALGVRSEFLGTNYENNNPLEELPSSKISKRATELASLVEYATCAIDGFYKDIYVPSENYKRLDLIIKEVISLANTSNPKFSIVFLVSQLEEQVERLRYNDSHDDGNLPLSVIEERSKIEALLYDAYKILSQVRNVVVHERTPISQLDIVSLVDSGVRLIKAFYTINNNWHNRYS